MPDTIHCESTRKRADKKSAWFQDPFHCLPCGLDGELKSSQIRAAPREDFLFHAKGVISMMHTHEGGAQGSARNSRAASSREDEVRAAGPAIVDVCRATWKHVGVSIEAKRPEMNPRHRNRIGGEV
jgi:hypothetical protein